MTTEHCLKANILQKRSPKGIRGFRWQKRMFRLYPDRIVYCVIQTDTPLGEIPLVCITKIIECPNNKKNRFNIIMGEFRTFELQSTTPNITNDWIQILRCSIGKFSKDDQLKMLQQQKDKFWKIENISNYQQEKATVNHTNNDIDIDTNSDPGQYEAAQEPLNNNVPTHRPKLKHHSKSSHANIVAYHDPLLATNNPQSPKKLQPAKLRLRHGSRSSHTNVLNHSNPHRKAKGKHGSRSSHTKIRFGAVKSKKQKKHKRGAQSNSFFKTNSKLKNRTEQQQDTTINHSGGHQEVIHNNPRHKQKAKHVHAIQRSSSTNEIRDGGERQRRLSVMDILLPSNILEYKVEEEFYMPDIESRDKESEAMPPFGKVAIVSFDYNPYLLQVCNKNDRNYPSGLAVMNRLSCLINPFIITQLQRGSGANMEWSAYNCPSNGCLTNCLHLFRNVSVTSVRILVAEVICGLQYLHKNNFNFPNLSPETIYISHKSHIILTDFGFAIPNSKDFPIYRSGPLCYAPPEFLLYEVDDMKSDWWRLGVLIYHLIVGKPPFMGSREEVCNEICGPITHETLFGQIDFEIDPITKDLITKLITRREDRLGCSKPLQSNKKKSKKYYGVEEIMHHPFFECICNKKNKDYHFTWSNIRKRQHKPAPILRHLATRAIDSPRNILHVSWQDDDTSINEDAKTQAYKRNINDDKDLKDESMIYSSDDEEWQTDEDEEKSQQYHSLSKSGPNTPAAIDDYIQPNSFSNSYNNLAGSAGSSGGNNLNSNSKTTASPLKGNTNSKPFVYPSPDVNGHNNNNANIGLSPLAQSPPPHIHVNKASVTSPKIATKSIVTQPKITKQAQPPSPIGVGEENSGGFTDTPRPITPIQSQFNIRPKGARHRKQISSKIDFVPTRALPPVPSRSLPQSNKQSPPKLTQSQPSESQSYGHNGLNILTENESDPFAQYVQHQQEQMGLIVDEIMKNDESHNNMFETNNNNKHYNKPAAQYAVPRLHNLHDQEEKKPINDASTIFSDQIAAAALLRQPILTEKQREKQKKKELKKLKKKAKRKSNKMDEPIHIKEKNKKYHPISVPTTPINKKKGKMGSAFTKKFRSKVSKKKRRFIDKVNHFDLDLTYITKRIIAMGFPSEGREEMYRNPTAEVKRFFDTYHHRRFKVYNLCIEKDRQYPSTKFSCIGGEVARFGFKDHNSPDLELVLGFCKDLHEWFSRDKKNVAAIHCKAGKGRTGVMICAYLAYSRICKGASDALAKYGEARTKNSKGVTIPSQRRWVLYFIDYVMNPKICASPDRFAFYQICILKRVRMITIPDFDIGGGCDPYFLIKNTRGEVLYDYSQHNPVKKMQRVKRRKKKNAGPGVLDVVKFRGLDIILRGSFKIVFYDKDVLSSDDIMCWCWLHSAVAAKEKKIVLDRENIDGAVKDKAQKRFALEFGLEFEFDRPVDVDKERVIETQPHLHAWIDNSLRQQQLQCAQKQSPPPQPQPQPRGGGYDKRVKFKAKGDGKARTKRKVPRPPQRLDVGRDKLKLQKRHSTMSSLGNDTSTAVHKVKSQPMEMNQRKRDSMKMSGVVRRNSNPSVPVHVDDDDDNEQIGRAQTYQYGQGGGDQWNSSQNNYGQSGMGYNRNQYGQDSRSRNRHNYGQNNMNQNNNQQYQQNNQYNNKQYNQQYSRHKQQNSMERVRRQVDNSQYAQNNNRQYNSYPNQTNQYMQSNNNQYPKNNMQNNNMQSNNNQYNNNQSYNNNQYNMQNNNNQSYNNRYQNRNNQSQHHNQHQNQGQYHENHHYNDGKAVQPPTISVNIMNTIRQNMQRRLNANTPESPGRKGAIV